MLELERKELKLEEMEMLVKAVEKSKGDVEVDLKTSQLYEQRTKDKLTKAEATAYLHNQDLTSLLQEALNQTVLERAANTADAVYKFHPSARRVKDARFMEMSFGALEGTRLVDPEVQPGENHVNYEVFRFDCWASQY